VPGFNEWISSAVTVVTGTGVENPDVRTMREPVTVISSGCGWLGCGWAAA